MLGLLLPQMVKPAAADVKRDIAAFLAPRVERILRSHPCLNYESIENSSKNGRQTQQWTRVRACSNGFCIYSGIAAESKIPVGDPTAWQQHKSILIPERDFYTVELFNDQYSASFIDNSRFEKDGTKSLERVEAMSRSENPPALRLLLGEAGLTGTIMDFVAIPSTTDLEFVELKRDGRPVRRLTANGKFLPRISSLYRCTWDFDAETGYCLKASLEPLGGGKLSRAYSIEYANTSGDAWIPAKLTMQVGPDDGEHTFYFRNWTTDCFMDPQECMLGYHGFKEPVLSMLPKSPMSPIDTTPRISLWFVWGNVGILLLVAGWTLSNRGWLRMKRHRDRDHQVED